MNSILSVIGVFSILALLWLALHGFISYTEKPRHAIPSTIEPIKSFEENIKWLQEEQRTARAITDDEYSDMLYTMEHDFVLAKNITITLSNEVERLKGKNYEK